MVYNLCDFNHTQHQNTDLIQESISEANNGYKQWMLEIETLILYTISIAFIFTLNLRYYFCYKREYVAVDDRDHDHILQNKIEKVLIVNTLRYSTGLLWYYLIYSLMDKLNDVIIGSITISALIFSYIAIYSYHYFIINRAIKNRGFVETIYAKVNDIDIISVMALHSNGLLVFILKMIELVLSSLGILSSIGVMAIIVLSNTNTLIFCMTILIINIILFIVSSATMMRLNTKRRKTFRKFRRYSVVLGL